MASVAMTKRSAGYVVPASEYNQFIDNDEACAVAQFTTAGDIFYGTGSRAGTRLALGTAGQVLRVNAGQTAPEWGGALLAATNTVNALTNTNETDVFSFTVPSGVLGSNRSIFGRIYYLYDDDTATTIDMKLYYGATAITADMPQNFAAIGVTGIFAHADFLILANGATNAQRLGICSTFRYSLQGYTTQGLNKSGTAAIDSAQSQTAKISFKQYAAGVSLTFLSGWAAVGA